MHICITRHQWVNIHIHMQELISSWFPWIKTIVYWFQFHWSLFLEVELTIRQHYSSNGLVPVKCQAITRTNVLWHHMTSLEGSVSLTLRHHMAAWILVNIGAGNGLLPDGTKPLPEPMLTNLQQGLVAFTGGQFHRKCSTNLSLIWVWKWQV